MRQLAEGLSDETGRYVSAAGKHPAGYHRAHGRNPPVRGSSAKNGSPSGALWREFFFCGPSGLRRLRGWAYRIRTGESVRELSDWNFVTTSPEVVQARRRRPFALELRCTNLQLRRIFSSLAGYYGDYSLAALGIQLDEIQHQRLLARV